MDLTTLDPTTLQPDQMVENYSSLIWTERYDKAGDFQLVTNDISTTLDLLPLESYVSLRDSTVPMLVEAHKIEKKKGVAPVLTVIGRSFEACALERRASVNSLPDSYTSRTAWTLTAAKESDAAYKALRIVLGDIARSQAGAEVLAALSPAVSPNDAIPEIDLILPVDYSTLFPNIYEIKGGVLYSTIMELITTNHHGIKSVRPDETGSKIGVEIYNGADLTNDVILDARFDQFDSATYLLSKQGSTNVGYVYGATGSQQVMKTAAPEPSGLDRRVLLLDQSSDTTVANSDIRKSRGLIELYKYNVTAMFDGEISQQVATGYNSKYFLGDLVKLTGEYGLSQNVRVTEFIKSSDAQGEKAYPTLEAVAE